MINKILSLIIVFTIQQCVKSSHFHPDVYLPPQYDVTIYRDTWEYLIYLEKTDRDAAYDLPMLTLKTILKIFKMHY